jgi:hypothetical protein
MYSSQLLTDSMNMYCVYRRLLEIAILGLAVLTSNMEQLIPDHLPIVRHLSANQPHDRVATDHERLSFYGGLPLVFEANPGHSSSHVDFLSRGPGYTISLSSREMDLSVPSSPGLPQAPGVELHDSAIRQRPRRTHLRMRLVGANSHVGAIGEEELAGKVSYFIGNDPSKWRTSIPTYAKVRYRDVYPGIDLVYYGNRNQLEYDFIVTPGSNPKSVQLQLEGAPVPQLDDRGNLLQGIFGQQMVAMEKPVAYQEIEGKHVEVSSAFVVEGERISFQVGAYDSARPLVIDPVLAYSTYLGGSDDESGWAIAVDAVGNAYITGDTNSSDFPMGSALQQKAGGDSDIFVAKISADGKKLLYSTYLGGSNADVGYGVAVDQEGNAYITGDTSSTDFPVLNPLQAKLAGAPDVFVAKLSPDGSKLRYSTYVGGTSGERGNGIAVDSSGNAYVVGYTHSKDFPTANPLQAAFGGGNADAFVFKINPTGSAFVYSTYLGGANDRPDIGTAIAVDSSGDAYITGFTNSRDFPTAKPIQPFVGPTDIFVSKLNPNGSALLYSTFIGGKADEEAMSIAVDSSGSAYITGETESPNFPTTPGALSRTCKTVHVPGNIGDICSGGDLFVTKLSPDGTSLVYSTFVNASGFEVGRGIAVDSEGSAYVTGITTSRDFPLVDPLKRTFGGEGWGALEAFVVRLNPSGSALVYSSYLGGSSDDAGYGIALDRMGNVYVTGYTDSADFPTLNPLRHGSPKIPGGARHIFVTKIASMTRHEDVAK